LASSRHLVDPELLPLLDLLPAFNLTHSTLTSIRARVEALAPTNISSESLSIAEYTIDGSHPVHLIVYRPNRSGPFPILLHMHGGGFVTGSAAIMTLSNMRLAIEVGCVVASVDYRLAPEATAPAALDDCYAAYRWIHAQADELDVDVSRIAIGGESAGGGLAAALALTLRDRGDPLPCLQWLIAPMLDDRTADAVDTRPHAGEFVWTQHANRFAWHAYLGHAPGAAYTSAYASPARALDLKGLPPAFIAVGGLDLFLRENISYTQRLIDAAVPAEFHIYPGAFHGFENGLDTGIGRRAERERHDALGRAFARAAAIPDRRSPAEFRGP
jgi:acetyl esterase/lipase